MMFLPTWALGPLCLMIGIGHLADGFSWGAVGWTALGAVLLAYQIHRLGKRIEREDAARR